MLLPGRLYWRDRNPASSKQFMRLVAETGADGDLVTALGAAAVEDGGTGLGLHAGEKTVGLGAVAAVGLEGTLRHGTELLQQEPGSCSNFWGVATILEYT
jgi:hypothetical protein